MFLINNPSLGDINSSNLSCHFLVIQETILFSLASDLRFFQEDSVT